MKIIPQGFEPETPTFAEKVNVEAIQTVARAPRRRRVQLQPIVTDGRLFHAYSA
jgi:hypothetical protein